METEISKEEGSLEEDLDKWIYRSHIQMHLSPLELLEKPI